MSLRNQGKSGLLNNLVWTGAWGGCFEDQLEKETAALNRLALFALPTLSFIGPAGSALPANSTPAISTPAISTSVIQSAFGNTIVSIFADGRRAQVWLNPDGSYTARARRHEPSDGHRKVKGARLCLRQSHPATLPISDCTPIQRDLSSKHGSGKALTGEPIEISLRPGRVAAPA